MFDGQTICPTYKNFATVLLKRKRKIFIIPGVNLKLEVKIKGKINKKIESNRMQQNRKSIIQYELGLASIIDNNCSSNLQIGVT